MSGPGGFPTMMDHFPYPAENVFLCIGHSPPNDERFRHAVDYEICAAHSADVAFDHCLDIEHHRFDGRAILPGGVISLAALKQWRRELDSPPPSGAPKAGVAFLPRRLFRRIWLIGGALRSDWALASFRWQAMGAFHQEMGDAILLACMGKKALDAWIGQMERGAKGETPLYYCLTDEELHAYFPPGFQSREEWQRSRTA